MSSFKKIWKIIEQKKIESNKRNLISLFSDSQRFENFSTECSKIFVDFSKINIDKFTLNKLFELFEKINLEKKKLELFEGKEINTSENLSPRHIFFRKNNFLKKSEKNFLEDNRETLEISEQIRKGKYLSVKKKKFKNIVNVGIGGSRNGNELITTALRNFSNGPDVLFISSLDSNEFKKITKELDPSETLFVIVSKTFKTIETIENAKKVIEWLKSRLNCDPSKNIICVTNNRKEAKEYFSDKIKIINIPEGLGGRFGLWGPFSLSALCNIGLNNYNLMLEGAEEIDENFFYEKNKNNLPLVLSIIDIWHRNFCNYRSRTIIPYDYDLRFFINYIQQLEMESNGKIFKNSKKNISKTAPITWGSSGSDAQHSFFQFLHQGSDITPCEFLIGVNDLSKSNSLERELLLKNCLAQSEALMLGNKKSIKKRERYKLCNGNRPSTTILFESLTPKILGSLISIYEHKTFVNGIFWKINSFDQWGVENAKKIYKNYDLNKYNDFYSKEIKKKIKKMQK